MLRAVRTNGSARFAISRERPSVVSWIGEPACLPRQYACYVGLNPSKDVSWVLYPPPEAKRLLAKARLTHT